MDTQHLYHLNILKNFASFYIVHLGNLLLLQKIHIVK